MKTRNIRHRPARGRADLEHIDATMLREIGLNAEDFRDAQEGRSVSALFTPFRDLKKR
ncbi:MAG: hypothetical protein ABI697_13900 [Devosia sp.]